MPATRTPARPEHPTRGLYRLAFVLVLAVLCLPVLTIAYHPLVDYPNHLARAYILGHYGDVPLYQRQYVISWRLVPNLAIDLIVPALLQLTDLVTASRAFLLLTVVSFAIGCHLLGAAIHERPTWLALPCAFFVYNSMLLYGFVNYVFGLGCFCWGLAYWIRRRHRWTPWQLGMATLLTLVAYVAHLTAYGFLVVAFVTIGGWDVWTGGASAARAALSLVPAVPGALLQLAQTVHQGGPGQLEWNTVSGKLIALLPLFLTYDHRFDLLFLVVLAAICGLALWVADDRGVVWPVLLTGGVLLALLVVSPKVVLTSSGVDARFFPPAALLVALSVKVTLRPRTAGLLLVACLALFSVRVGSIWTSWVRMDEQIGEQVRFLSILPEGARVYPAFPAPALIHLTKQERSFEHVISLATITRRAYVFSQFANPAQQPLLFRTPPVFVPLADRTGGWLRSVDDAQYVWSYGIPESVRALLAGRCVPLATRNGFTIWKVVR